MTSDSLAKTTPRPWKAMAWHTGYVIRGAHQEIITYRTTFEDATLIVTSVNGIDALREENLRLREALLLAGQFIVNGTELGFIRMPDKNDSALDTLPKIRAALGEVTRDGT